MSKIKIILIDDDFYILDSLSKYFNSMSKSIDHTFDIKTCPTIDEALICLSNNFDIAIIDVAFPGDPNGGLRIINFINSSKLKVKPIIYSAYPGSITPDHINHSYGVIQKGTSKSKSLLMQTILFAFNYEKVFIHKENFKSLSHLPINSNEIVEESIKLMNWVVKNNHKQVCSLKDQDDIYSVPSSCSITNFSKSENIEKTVDNKQFHNKIKIVISYSKKDEEEKNFCMKISEEINTLKQEDIVCWFDKKIEGGEDWDGEIKTRFQNSHIILCLISKNFLLSEYILTNELPIIKQKIRHNFHVIPILYSKCRWNVIDWVSKIQLLNNQPYCECLEESQEDIINKLIERIKKLAKTIRSEK